MSVPQIGQRSNDLLIASEVSSKAYYNKKLQWPEWPGGASGITIMIGYDVGYATPKKLDHDLGGKIPGSMIDALKPCCGVTGQSARALLPEVRSKIKIPWDVAVDVFDNIDVPEWTNRVIQHIPKAADLPCECLGVLTGLAYNRGASFDNQGARYVEMRNIKTHIQSGTPERVSDDLRSMKRLWPNMAGLRIRRDKEADLWDWGLVHRDAPVVARSSENPDPLVPIPKTGGAEGSATIGGGGATIQAGRTAAEAGWSPAMIGAVVIGGLVVTGIAVMIIRNTRSKPVLARAKG